MEFSPPRILHCYHGRSFPYAAIKTLLGLKSQAAKSHHAYHIEKACLRDGGTELNDQTEPEAS